MEIVLIIFIVFVSWFFAKTGGYHNYLTAKEENEKLIEEENTAIMKSMPDDIIENFDEYSSGRRNLDDKAIRKESD